MNKIIASIALSLTFLFFSSYKPAEAQKFKKTGEEGKNNKFVKSNNDKQALGPGTVVLPSGLQYKDIKIGEGATPVQGQRIKIHFEMTLFPKGTEIMNTYKQKVPFACRLGSSQLIKGLNIAIATMKVGGKREILVPPELGYGEKQLNYKTPPNSTFKYVVELISVH